MEPPISTAKSAGLLKPSNTLGEASPASLDLELPVEPGFVSRQPCACTENVLEISFYYLQQFMRRPAFWQARASSRCTAEFDLDHPERVEATYPTAMVDELLSH
jgi:hypothetical protein